MSSRHYLPLKALHSFESAATHLNLSKAGEDLGVTHGAVSHQVRALETHLGVKLFSRAHNRLSLTPAGQRLFSSVKAAFETLLEGTRNLNPQDLSGSLTIACTQTIATSWANDLICRFYTQYPTIDITVREIKPRANKIPRDVDIAICYGRPAPDDRQIKKLNSPRLYPVCNPKLLRADGQLSRPKDIAKFTLIHDHQVSWHRWLEAYSVEPSDCISNIYFPNTNQALSVARQGHGVALANALETQKFIKNGQLVRLIDKPINEEKSYYLLTQNLDTQNLKAQIFEEHLLSRIGETPQD